MISHSCVFASLFAPNIQDDLSLAIVKNIRSFQSDVLTENISITFYPGSFSNIPSRSVTANVLIPEGAFLLGKTLVKVSYLDQKNKVILTQKIPVEVKAKAQVFYTVKKLDKGHVFQDIDIHSSLIDISNYSAQRLKKKEDIIGKEAKTMINAETILTSWMLTTKPDIRSGDKVKVIIQQKNFEIAFSGLVIEDGFIGQKVRVQSDYKDRRILTGEVLDEGHVRVKMGY